MTADEQLGTKLLGESITPHYTSLGLLQFPDIVRDKPSKKMFKKALLRWYLAQY